MGFNLHLACHTCRQQRMAMRGEEPETIRAFSDDHRDHQLGCFIDHGFENEPDWSLDYSEDEIEVHGIPVLLDKSVPPGQIRTRKL